MAAGQTWENTQRWRNLAETSPERRGCGVAPNWLAEKVFRERPAYQPARKHKCAVAVGRLLAHSAWVKVYKIR